MLFVIYKKIKSSKNTRIIFRIYFYPTNNYRCDLPTEIQASPSWVIPENVQTSLIKEIRSEPPYHTLNSIPPSPLWTADISCGGECVTFLEQPVAQLRTLFKDTNKRWPLPPLKNVR